VITTHYANLKHFAASAEGIVNGAMLYDAGRMTPLFRLEIGSPGSSFAFEIARQIGLPREIIDDATDKIGEERVMFDKHLKEITRDKRYWEEKRRLVHQEEKRLEETLQRYRQELEETARLRKEILGEAREKAREMLRTANASLEATIREIRESQAEKERTRAARQAFEQEKARLLEAEEEEARLQRRIERLKEREKRKARREGKPPVEGAPPAAEGVPVVLAPGDFVRLDNNATGEVLEVTAKSVTVALGHLVTTVKPSRLTRLSRSRAREVAREQPRVVAPGYTENISRARASFQPEIDVRGLRAEEAIMLLSAFLDDAVMLGEKELRVLHGTGTGALKQSIREYLRTSPLVARAVDEHVQLGGAGITKLSLDI
jgi:DNA mismatch repair protein MutS2